MVLLKMKQHDSLFFKNEFIVCNVCKIYHLEMIHDYRMVEGEYDGNENQKVKILDAE